MIKEIDDKEESKRLNTAVKGRTINKITYNEVGDSDIEICFDDRGRVVLSTLGGVELKEIE